MKTTRTSKNNAADTDPDTPHLSERTKKLIKESWLGVWACTGIYLMLILASYSQNDSSWSHTSSVAHSVDNLGGMVGAWISDLLLSAFGFSAWWLVLAVFYVVIILYQKIEGKSQHHNSWFFHSLGFLLLTTASATFESAKLQHLPAVLPLGSGGAIGAACHDFLQILLGHAGAMMLSLVLLATGFSLSTGYSWLTISEKIGLCSEKLFLWVQKKWESKRISTIAAAQPRRPAEKSIIGKIPEEDEPEPERLVAESPKPVMVTQAESAIEKTARVPQDPQVDLFDTPTSAGGLPPLHLLDRPQTRAPAQSHQTLEQTSRLIEQKLQDFNIQVTVTSAMPGPVITRYEFEPAPGIKGSQITNLSRDLARALSVVSVRVIETIPNKNCMGIEIPNAHRQIVYLSEILGSAVYADMMSPLCIAMGKDISGNPTVADLVKMPHVLVAGTTGSGKSVAINAMILSLLYKSQPSQVRLLLIDPKMLELSVYEGIPHLLAPIVTDMRQAGNVLNWCVAEMDKRYRIMSSLGVRNINGFNQKVSAAATDGQPICNPFSLTPENPEPLGEMPMIVVIIDELADMMMVIGKKVEELIARLAQKARAAGIHLVLATQRPSVDVITGLIKANIPTRVAFQVSSKIDSRTILDQMGAESLLGQGDMLYQPPGSSYSQRIHGAFVSDQEVHRVVEFLKRNSTPNYVEGILTGESTLSEGDGETMGGNNDAEQDPLYDEAVNLVLKSRRASISSVQRQLRIGYNRAANLIEQMEQAGLVSPMQSNGNREVLVPSRDE